MEGFPDGVGESEFRALYRAELARHTPELTDRLRRLLARGDVAAEVERVQVVVFADEDGDGVVSAGVYFEGRNRKVSKTDPSLYSGAHVDLTDGMRVPFHDPEAYEFDPRDVSVAAVIDWFAE
jgi:hypothetical protein